MNLMVEPYLQQRERWPKQGKHITAQFDDEGLVVYQAYSHEIGSWVVSHGQFGGPWKFDRYSWIKPNFLWMMYRSGWGQKVGQQVVLAVKLRWSGVLELLNAAVHSKFRPDVYESPDAWQEAMRRSAVRLQWDPDHSPVGGPLARRAILLGLSGVMSRRYASEWVASIEDISDFVAEQRAHVQERRFDALLTPREAVWRPSDDQLARKLLITQVNEAEP